MSHNISLANSIVAAVRALPPTPNSRCPSDLLLSESPKQLARLSLGAY